ncbi:MAG: cyclic nucleotide-binding domain-containing protein [Myxococcales bacterium]|nr:cyclic nucleotide-binding domain-containing protein [Myxococcales bacterium]
MFDAPLLRGLDEPARARVVAAGRVMECTSGQVIAREGERGDSLYVVARGVIALTATPRGNHAPEVIRRARKGESFGEEVCLPGGLRRATATVEGGPAQVAAIPVSVFQRGLGRDADDPRAKQAAAARLRQLERQATADLLRTMVLTRGLDDDDRDLVLDAVTLERHARGARIYGVGERARDLFMLASGLVQLQTEDDDGRIQVRAYLSPGDFFGDQELALARAPSGGDAAIRQTSAVALGECQLLRLPGAALRTLLDRNPGMIERLRRITSARRAHQSQVVSQADARSTRHVFHDLYRMQMASSLLTIDQDTCVRCGHCAWSCAATHDGVSRLVRRGDKILTQLAMSTGTGSIGRLVARAETRSLLLPNSCQHCKNPACMIDCPTGAIGRDPEGEVFIRESLCTGCGNCAKACPWENIRMAPRPRAGASISEWLRGQDGATPQFPEVAVKCDLCREYEAPACVQGCPTGSLIRLDPERDFAEVAAVLGGAPAAGGAAARDVDEALTRASAWLATLLWTASAVTLALVGLVSQLRGAWRPGAGLGAVGRRARGRRDGAARRPRDPEARGVAVDAAAAEGERGLGVAAALEGGARRKAPALARAPVPPAAPDARAARVRRRARARGRAAVDGGFAGLLTATFWLTAALGGWGAWAYRALPQRLSRLEREGALPEDLRGQREALLDRFHRELSGRSDLVKRAARVVLLPYALSRAGALALLLSGRSADDERRRVHARVLRILGEQDAEQLAGLTDVVRTAVELRALPARRLLTAALRGFFAAHVVISGLALALLVAHVLVQIGGLG